jgi:hypothetical protein
VKKWLVLLVALMAYAVVILPFTGYLAKRPVMEKIGYIPDYRVLRFISADHRAFVGASLVLKAMVYFGSLQEKSFNKLSTPPDYLSMYQAIYTGLKLDPYNMDAYYFAQAFMVWDAGRAKEANALLDYGMKYRTWDFMLPFFAGFNSAYFLKDYAKAAEYYKKAGELSGAELYTNLAGRYLWQSGRTGQAIAYLTMMEKGAGNEAVRKSFRTRLQAFQEVRRIELARDRFRDERGRAPETVEELLRSGVLSPPPRDPYGGRFYLEPDGQVATTSKFTYAAVPKK